MNSFLEDLIPHVFLPLQVSSRSIVEIEPLLLHQVTDAIDYVAFDLDKESLRKLRNTFRQWESLQNQENMDARDINNAIIDLTPGDDFALYIRDQNAGLLISMLGDENHNVSGPTNEGDDVEHQTAKRTAVFSTFPACQPMQLVTSAEGDLASIYPTTSIIVTASSSAVVKSKCFALQLATLSSNRAREAAPYVIKSEQAMTEVREVPSPILVAQWLSALLVDERSRQSNKDEMPRIIKKIRDRVVYDKESTIPFRRSGLWNTIKVVLQLCLARQFGEVDGKFLYKLIILKVMVNLIQHMNVNLDTNTSAAMHGIGKIARRTMKLQIYANSKKVKQTFLRVFEEFSGESAKVLHKIRGSLKSQWDDFIKSEMAKSNVPVVAGKLDTCHSLRHNGLLEYLLSSRKARYQNVLRINVPEPYVPKRHCFGHVKFPRKMFFDCNEDSEHLGTTLFDFESNVFCWENFITLNDFEYVWDVFQDYVTLARKFYTHDPIGLSRMILVCLKMVKEWDSLVTDKFPMLKEHRPGIDLGFTSFLVLPGRTTMHQLFVLEKYFKQREEAAIFPSLIEEEQTFPYSFSVRYAKEDAQMQQVKQHILHLSNMMQAETLRKVHAKRQECEKLQTEIRSLECEYSYNEWKRYHSRSCKKCQLVQKEKKCVVSVYEKPLPIIEESQDAVMFELMVPRSILCLRDILFLFGASVTCYIAVDEEKELYGPWNTYVQLISHNRNRHHKPFVVSLMSSSKLFLESHYRCHHATNPDCDFIVNNGFNLRLAGNSKPFQHLKPTGKKNYVRVHCAFKVQKKTPYSTLQWAVNGGETTYNQVLARQNECHRDLSLAEFVEFGSLRASYPLQLRNLYRALTQMTVSLKTESVFSLISQTLWEAGFNNSGNLYRDAHQEYQNNAFISEFLELVENRRKKHAHNWKDHYVLLTIIIFALRTISLTNNQEVLNAAFLLLDRCREMAMKWSGEIRKLQASTFDAPRSEIDALRLKMIEVNACCALTFSVDPHHYSKLGSHAALLTWLLAIASIYDNSVLLGSGHSTQREAHRELPRPLQNLLRRVREAGLNFESFLHQKLHESTFVLNSFVEVYNNDPNYFELGDDDPSVIVWRPYNTADNVYYCELFPRTVAGSKVMVLQIDIVGGSFLVNGCPVSYLPSTIENHPEFQRVFPMRSFEVKPYAFQQGRFITRDPFCDSYYSFFLMDNESLVITEHRPMNVTLELLPSNMMAGNIPHLLVDGCSHWWNKEADVVEFFKRDDTKAYKLYYTKPRYMLYLGDDRFVADLAFRPKTGVSVPTGESQRRTLVDLNCAPYAKIVDIVRRLEYVKFVNIWYSKHGDKKQHIVELPRMGLQFELSIRSSKSGMPYPVLMSKEYRGMKVADKQMLGTLVGLKNGLLLEDANVNSAVKMPPLLLMPHGEPTIKGNHNLEIQTKQLRTPAFFAYEFDERLRQLRARESQSAWLFLAFLHAATSSSLPDPFTQVTGTERAFEILQSGHCWTGQPLDEECLTTLNDISRLAPVRQFYPPIMKTMETVKWKVSMPGDRLVSLAPQVSHDGFQLIAQKLLRDSERLNFLFPRNTNADWKTAEERQESVTFDSDNMLCTKAYWQRVGLSTKEGRISSDFDEAFDLKRAPAVRPISTNSAFEITFTGERMNRTLRISQLAQKWKCIPASTATKLVQNLLLTQEDLKGVLVGDGYGYQKNEDWRSWAELAFRDNWLDLYNFARRVERVGMQIEWAHMLTMLAFRVENPVPFDHLLFLHSIAVNPDEFQNKNPPPHIEYFVTNECDFDSEVIRDVLRACALPWAQYMDARAIQMKEGENLNEFIERMRPDYDDAIEQEITTLARDLQLFWPTRNCEKVPSFDRESESTDIIVIEDAKKNVNATLKNWYNNMELRSFLQEIEARVESLKPSKDKQYEIKDMGKQLLRPASTQAISQYFKREVLTINLTDILMRRDCAHLDFNYLEKVIHFFDNEGKIPPMDCSSTESSSSSRILNPNINMNFPLETTSDCPILGTYMTELRESWRSMKRTRTQQSLNIYNTGQQPHEWAESLKANRVKANEMWERIKGLVKPIGTECDNVTKALISAELFPRVTPLTMLPFICKRFQDPYLNYVKKLLGVYGVLVTLEQRAARCFRYMCKEKKGKERNEFQRELELERENPGHENWNPAKRPHWLLFEIEMDVMIRKVQAKVAERMENPVEDKNALLQLNMGEGKTAVIVPLLILSFANGSQLCRVTVLKSLYEINQKALISTLGGLLLNRRVYTFPCRRDFALGHQEVGTIFEVYRECMAKCGVVMTLPEYRLSFQLKMYEKCGAENYADGKEFLHVQHWLVTHTRDVLDESDEILHVKYQLIYTIGKQQSISGGSTRWVVLQKLLKLVPEHLRAIKWKFANSIELTERPEPQYPFCRLLKSDCSEKLCTRLAEDVINGYTGIRIPVLRAIKRGTVMKFLTNPIVDRETINKTFEYFPLEVHREILLILRGLLACGVLNTALTKRWRVNYGVNPSGYRRVAVPFRAKDVAAERTEFGHPDIAIILTQLSYYYSGLSDDEIYQSFMLLFKQPDPNAEYNLWISSVPDTLEGFEAIKMLSGVNLKDFYQRTQILFPVFRFNTATIDFWLSHVVFPQESKQFAWKIGCSPWDLCAETAKPTTGFSGTNESKLLLPKTIAQNDLPELLGTNGSVLRNLLKSDNNKYEALEAGLSGKGILEKLVVERIRILLDVGALMLELNNEQVAQVWLELEDEDYIDAAVYFDVSNKLVVADRTLRRPVSLELSTYRTRLDRCIIYLDDVHTRGTDLKIPPSSKGCVTLGKGVTKDKLVQGCMRMRKLGHGHTVVFWASSEVDSAIKEMVLPEDHATIGSKEVLQWTIENSRAAIEDGFMHWANAGVYQAQKLSSHYLFNCSKKTDFDLKLLADSCSLKETTDLRIMYGEVKSFQPFPVLVQFMLKRVKREMEKRLKKSGKEIKHNVEGIVSAFGEAVVNHTSNYVADKFRSSQTTDEEQERELEHELEAEQEKELPPKYRPNPHSIHPSVENFVVNGDLHGIETWAVKLPLALYRTTLWKLCKVDTWGQHIYATHEFQNVIKSELKSDVLRPVQWFCSLAPDEGDYLLDQRNKDRRSAVLLISPFEANYFINFIRTGMAKVFLHMYASRLSPEQDTLCNNARLLVPVPLLAKCNALTSNMNASLLLFSGSSYFSCKEEQDEYCQIVGFCLQDRNEAERKVYEEGGIQDGFFVKPDYRARVGIVHCQFQENPEALIREIIRTRFGNFSGDSHVGKMIHLCRKPFAE